MVIESIGGLVVLLMFIFAVIKIGQSNRGTGAKVLWIAIVFFMPILGFIIWYLAGPGDKSLTI